MNKKNNRHEPELNYEERLRIENEVEKLKLSAFHDVTFFIKSELPPEIENEWLKYIQAFEEQSKNIDQIAVAERLGNPQFPSVDELSDNQIRENLDKILDLMYENGICLDALPEVSDAKLYRFITKELFLEEIDDFNIEGMMTCFIYEDFYPNDRYDIEQTIENFISEMLSKEFRDYLSTNLASDCKSHDGEPLTTDQAVEKTIAFSDLFERFSIKALSDFEIDIEEDEQEAAAHFFLEYEAYSKSEITPFKGKGTAKLRVGERGYWNIVSLAMPGFVI